MRSELSIHHPTAHLMRVLSCRRVFPTLLLFAAACGEPDATSVQFLVENAGQGGGSVASSDGSILCDLSAPAGSCTFTVPEGAADLTLTATAAAGSHFSGWSYRTAAEPESWTSGCADPGTTVCHLDKITGPTVVRPLFDLPNILVVMVFGGGRVTGTAGMDCQDYSQDATSCRRTYGPGATVTMAQSVGVFRGWGAPCTTSPAPCSFNSDSTHWLYAYFGDMYPPSVRVRATAGLRSGRSPVPRPDR